MRIDVPFYAGGLRFDCMQCSYCCRHEPGLVYIGTRDLASLVRWSNLSAKSVVALYCRWVPYSGGNEALCLREKTNYDCILWSTGCTAYDARPIQCATFPFWTHTLQSEAAWNACSKDCPGINKGNLHTAEAILAKLQRYEANVPLTRGCQIRDV